LPLKKVLLTCKDDNYGSIAVIEKNGGVLQDKIEDVVNGEKRLTRRYWIEI
jgi:predicted acetyltransferase